jgi:hypothetical protein
MTLQNLVGISLDRIAPAKETIRRLLDGAARHIADAKVQAVSAETRFGSAYTAIRMLADVGLHDFAACAAHPTAPRFSGRHRSRVVGNV